MIEGSGNPPEADLVSVVMPCRNAGPFLSPAIESVRAQSWPHWELLIVDDRSSDGSLELARRHAAEDARIFVLALERHGGPARARNLGIAHARGRWIAFLDADDLWMPDKLERQLAFMREQGAVFGYTGFWRIDEQGRKLGAAVPVPERVGYDDLLDYNVVSCITVLYDRRALGTPTMPDLPSHEDLGCWLAVLARIGVAHGLDLPLAAYRRRSGSRSYGKLRAARLRWRLMRDHERLPLLRCLRHFSVYAVRGLARELRTTGKARSRLCGGRRHPGFAAPRVPDMVVRAGAGRAASVSRGVRRGRARRSSGRRG